MQTLFLDFETLQFGTQSKNSNINYKVYAHLCIWQLERDILQWNLIALWCIEIWYHRRRCGNLWFLWLTFCIIYFIFQDRISLWILWISWSISRSYMCSFIVDYFNRVQCNFTGVVGATICQGKFIYNKIIQRDMREPGNTYNTVYL
jgi:hypothetical protein